MPLKKGKSSKTVSKNIRYVYERFKKTGKIGASKPGSKAKALRQAIAIALSTAGKKLRKRGKKK